MSHKSHPKGIRLQVIETWDSRWFAPFVNYNQYLKQDLAAREMIMSQLKDAAPDSIIVERGRKDVTFTVFVGKPGVAIGRGGKGIEDLQKKLEKTVFKFKIRVRIQIQEVKSPSLSAPIVAQGIRMDIEKRMPFRRVMKQAIDRVIKAGAQGVKIRLSGRLNGVEIARDETLSSGKVPLQTLRSNIEYALDEAKTTYGVIGIKVWIYKGEVFERIDKLANVKGENRK